MGKIDAFYIKLDNLNGVYFAGQAVTGRVILKLSCPLETRGIRVKVVGQASVEWQRGRNRVSEHEVYFREYPTLIGYNGIFNEFVCGTSMHTIPPGDHSFAFSYTLPRGIPSSFESYYGRVFYHCKGEIDLPWKFDPKCKAAFTVNAISDLNVMPDMSNPFCQNKQKILCFLCFPEGGPLSLVVTTNRKGYVPGESILVNAEISNFTRSTISGSKAVLKMYTYYEAGWWSSKNVSTTLTVVAGGPIEPGKIGLWNAVPVPIPPVPPTGLEGCDLIHVHYVLKFVVVTPITSRNLVVKCPIFIGSIPLQSSFNQYRLRTPPPPLNLNEQPCNPPTPTFSEYPDLGPPSYREAVFGNAFIGGEDDKEDEPYKPSYTYYNMI